MFKSLGFLMSSTLISSVLTFITQMMIAKNTSPEFFGNLTGTLSLIMILAPLMAFGADGYLLRYYAEKKGNINDFGSNWLFYWLASFVLCYIIYDYLAYDMSRLFFLIVISQSLINISVSYLQASGKYSSVSVLLSAQSILRFVILYFLFYIHFLNDKYIYISYVFVSICMIILSLYFICKFDFICVNFNGLKSFILSSYPYGLSIILHLIYFQSDIFLVNKLYSSYEAGLYSLAFTLISASYLLPSVLYQKYLLPKIHQMEINNINSQKIYFYKGGLAMIIISVIIFFFFFFFSDYIVDIFFDDKYEKSILFIKILSLCIIFRYMSSNAGVYLMNEFLIGKKNKVMLFCAIFNVVLNFIFIPYYGALAAAIITVVTEIILCISFYFLVNKYRFSIFN
ncbi:oligosaccharide flippase family protein [Photobacterium damselae]